MASVGGRVNRIRTIASVALAAVWVSMLVIYSHAAGVQVSRPSTSAPVSVSVQSAATARTLPANPSLTPIDIKALVDQYCATCHNERTQSGGLVLSTIDFTNAAAHAEPLEKVVRKLGTGAMPPPGTPRPDKATYDALISSIAGDLDRAAAAHPDPGHVPLRRLNRTEYANAVRDLLDLHVDVSGVLPVDNATSGFDNIAGGLGVSPVLMQSYLTAARRVSAIAIGDALEIPVTAETYRVAPDMSQDRHVEGLPFGTRGGLIATHTFPLDAEYTINVRLLSTMFWNVKGLDYPHTLVLLIDGAEAGRMTFGGHEANVQSFANAAKYNKELHDRLVFRVPVKAGTRTVGVTFIQKARAVPHSMLQPVENTTYLGSIDFTGLPHIESVVLTGPYDAIGPGDTPSRRRVFVCRPAGPAEEIPCAREILSTLARRAYRRPLTDTDIGTLMQFFETGRRTATFDAGVGLALRFILASPDFVFRLESDPANVAPGTVHQVSDLELASRLSFFLWSSIPDEELLQLASQGTLRDSAVLDRQVRRMLADAKAGALVDNFAGQWLYLRNLRAFVPDAVLFADFDDTLRSAMVREVELFFENIMREDRSVVDLMTADDTFVNERLANTTAFPTSTAATFGGLPWTRMSAADSWAKAPSSP